MNRSSFPCVPLAVPYWNRETYRRILRCLISGCVTDGPQIETLKLQIVETLGVTDALLCGSGSLALQLALRGCNVGSGDEVVLPTFCCTAVVPPVLALGATPVLADVGDELNLTSATIEAVLTRKTKAVIVPHLFGNPAEIVRIVDLVRGRDIRIIDDAAQALGATIDGEWVGSFGDAGVLSFGAEKVCFGLGGGVAVSRHNDVASKFSQTELSPSVVVPAIKNLAATFFWRRLRRWTLPFNLASASPDALPVAYPREAMSNLAAAVALSLVQTLRANISARRARVQVYRELLTSCPGLELIAHRNGSACLTQVIRIVSRRRGADLATKLISTLGALGYEVQGSYVPIHLLSSFGHCVWDHLPCAERVWPELVELPCEPSVSLADIERIAAIVKNTVG